MQLPLITIIIFFTHITVKSKELQSISATSIDHLSINEIRQKYKEGFRIDFQCLGADLKSRIDELKISGMNIQDQISLPSELQEYTLDLIKDYKIKYFFNAVAKYPDGIKAYIHNELLLYGFRPAENLTLDELNNLSLETLESTYQASHFWKNIGFAHPKNRSQIETWIKHEATNNQEVIAAYLTKNNMKTDDKRLHIIMKISVLDIASNAVRGLYYLKQQAPLTFYRAITVDSWMKNKPSPLKVIT